MMRTSLIVASFALAGSAIAQSVIVSQLPLPAAANENGILAGESDRFGDFRGGYPADPFVLTERTTLVRADFFGAYDGGTGGRARSYSGWTVTIFRDAGDEPLGLPYDPAGAYGTTAFLQLPNVSEATGLTYLMDSDGRTDVRIDFSVANAAELTLDPGTYWMSIVPRMPSTPLGDPSGRWNWQMSPTPSSHALVSPLYINSDNGIWSSLSTASFTLPEEGETMAWELIGTTVQTGCTADVNGDGLATPADFNAWIQAFNTQAPECDQNGDGLCNPADFNAWVQNFNVGC